MNMLFAIPPNWEQARIHGEAQRARYYDPHQNLFNCKCFWCGRVTPEFSRNIGLWEKEDKLIEYGDGYPLLFQFIRQIIWLFVYVFIIQGIYMIILGIVLYRTVLYESVTFISFLSIQAIENPNDKFNQSIVIIYEVLSMITNFFTIGYICFLWVNEARYKNLLDEKTITDADYAVMLYNLPINISKPKLFEIIKRSGVDESNVIYTNKWFDFEKILKLKKKQYHWLHKKKLLEVFRSKKKKMGFKDYKTLYPNNILTKWPPCSK